MRFEKWYFIFFILLLSCKAYKQDILFRVENAEVLEQEIEEVEKNYVISNNDLLSILVFSNDGEQLIDQNFIPPFQQQAGGGQNLQAMQLRNNQAYLVQSDGTVKLPIVDQVFVEGTTLNEAEDILEEAYSSYFKEPFVKLEFLNKRVVVLAGEKSQVIPLPNQNLRLPEVLALAGGLNFGEKAQNIRVLRGELSSPRVFSIDLSTVEGMKNSIIEIEPGDVIYIEPWRRPWREAIRDASPIISVVTSFATLVFLVMSSTN